MSDVTFRFAVILYAICILLSCYFQQNVESSVFVWLLTVLSFLQSRKSQQPKYALYYKFCKWYQWNCSVITYFCSFCVEKRLGSPPTASWFSFLHRIYLSSHCITVDGQLCAHKMRKGPHVKYINNDLTVNCIRNF